MYLTQVSRREASSTTWVYRGDLSSCRAIRCFIWSFRVVTTILRDQYWKNLSRSQSVPGRQLPNAYSRRRSGEGRSYITKSVHNLIMVVWPQNEASRTNFQNEFSLHEQMQYNGCSKMIEVLWWQLIPGAERQLKRGVIFFLYISARFIYIGVYPAVYIYLMTYFTT